MIELTSKALDQGLISSDKTEKKCSLKINYCMADSDGRCVVISPDGDLYHCEHLPGNTSFGNIFDKTYDLSCDKRAGLEADDRCKKCRFLPECTPFFHNGCPNCFMFCDRVKDVETEYRIRKLKRSGD